MTPSPYHHGPNASLQLQLTYIPPPLITRFPSHVPDAAVTVLTWMESKDWTEFVSLLRLAGVAEGDVSRLVTQTAEHLNQLSRLNETHPALAATAEEGRLEFYDHHLLNP